MLTATDIHYLVGLLFKGYEGTGADIELGAQLEDVAAGINRDIDITVKQSNGKVSVFKGIEVKKYSKPLDIVDVEQLCMKFHDIPSLDQKAIVSASGYTNAAVKKATAHGIDLFELCVWTGFGNEVSNLIFDKENFRACEYSANWVSLEPPILEIMPEDRPKVTNAKYSEFFICTKDGILPKGAEHTQHLWRHVADNALSDYCSREYGGLDLSPGVEDRELNLTVKLLNPEYHRYKNSVIPVHGYTFKGVARFTVIQQKTEFKILVKHGNPNPYIGCAVIEMTNGSLIGVSTDKNNPFQIIQIPKVDRAKNKIYKQTIS